MSQACTMFLGKIVVTYGLNFYVIECFECRQSSSVHDILSVSEGKNINHE